MYYSAQRGLRAVNSEGLFDLKLYYSFRIGQPAAKVDMFIYYIFDSCQMYLKIKLSFLKTFFSYLIYCNLSHLLSFDIEFYSPVIFIVIYNYSSDRYAFKKF
jgi:hypothetical protein